MRRYLLAIVILSVLGAGIFTAESGFARKQSAYRVTASFDKAIGLFPQSDVRVLGVPIGKVTSVIPQAGSVKVVMQIELGRKIPASATASVIPISLISDRYIQFSPPYVSGLALADGAIIGTDRTTVPAELDDLLSSLKSFLDAVQAGNQGDPGALSSAVTGLANALTGTGPNIDQTLGSVGTISGVVTAQADKVESLVVHLSSFLKALADKQQQLAELNSNLATGLGAVADEQSSLDSALKNLAGLTDELGRIVKDHRGDLEQDLASASRATQAVVRHQDSLIQTNDWLHVIADGGEYQHNGGAVHPPDCPVPGSCPPTPIHLDVRDAHYGSCPIPQLCQSLFFQAGDAIQQVDVAPIGPPVPVTQRQRSARRSWFGSVAKWFEGRS